jgi:hypothetical protein
MAVLQGEQARQAMARMQRRAYQVPVDSGPAAAAPAPVTDLAVTALLRRSEDAKRACA